MRPSLFYPLAILIGVLDQVSKTAILHAMPYGASRPALGSFLFLTHTHNTGGAFSLFQARNSIFILIAAVAMIALVVAYQQSSRRHLMVSAALALALGGAIGNVIDRMRFGYVVDFFDLHGWTNHSIWPIFNIADSSISVGIVILAFHFLLDKGKAVPADHPEPLEPARPEPAQTERPNA